MMVPTSLAQATPMHSRRKPKVFTRRNVTASTIRVGGLRPEGTAVMRPNGRLSRFLLGALGFCAGVFLIAVLGDYLFNLLLTLLALGLIVCALEPLARKRGWGS